MLSDFPAATMIPARDLAGTRRFYEDVLGFTPDLDEPGAVSYVSAGSRFNLYESGAGGAQHTLIGWFVDDIDTTADELIRRGVTFERYEMPGATVDGRGVTTMGEERAAWFKDPEGNLLSIWRKRWSI